MPVQTQMQVRRGTASSWTSTNPTLAAGELGFETDTGKFKIGTGSSTWNSLLYAGGGQSSLTTYQYTATAAQTTFSGTDANGNTLSYTVGAIQVYLNGALLQNTADYAATNGTSVVLTAGALAGDSLTILSLATFDVANTYTQAQADALFIADTIVDAKGDIIAATAADTVSRLAVGANDTVLTADSSTATGLKWATPASGSLTLISTTAMTSGSAITLSSIPTTYNSLYFTITSWRASADALIRITFNGAASANDYADVPADQTDINFAASFLQLTGQQDSAATNSFVRGNLPNYSDSTSWKILESTSIENDATTNTRVRGFFGKIGATDQTAAITSLVFTLNTGTFVAGTLNLYGVK
jgi:hypothetical protein